MNVSSSSLYNTGLSAIQAGLSRQNADAQSVASQSTDYQSERLRAVDRSQQQDLAASMVDMSQAKLQVEAGAKVEKASDEALGRLIDTYA
ncbi:pyrroloquinoline quinone biosynthesis protein PqqE [Pseudomonas sp. NPDC007930]|uniref:pyrroloquinoline quinone biosynthesis protein PqqE n=1 Tax=Pseudomonas sp. NPDC007930 TaxID=3364417 RepID=UPI0036E53462